VPLWKGGPFGAIMNKVGVCKRDPLLYTHLLLREHPMDEVLVLRENDGWGRRELIIWAELLLNKLISVQLFCLCWLICTDVHYGGRWTHPSHLLQFGKSPFSKAQSSSFSNDDGQWHCPFEWHFPPFAISQ
jgi:hypothetical protein